MRCVSQPAFPCPSSLCCWDFWLGNLRGFLPAASGMSQVLKLVDMAGSVVFAVVCSLLSRFQFLSLRHKNEEVLIYAAYNTINTWTLITSVISAASGCTADRNILPDSQHVLHLGFLALRNCSWINCYQFPIRQTGNRSSVLWSTAG